MTASRELPKYQCHKQVWALKIKAIAHKSNPDTTGRTAASSYGATITPFEDGYGAFDVSPEYMNKYQPQVGGYYVVYEDGYKSYSPAPAFESGYAPVGSVLSTPHSGAARDIASDPHANLCLKQGEPVKSAAASASLHHINGPFASPAVRDDNERNRQAQQFMSGTGQSCRDMLALPVIDHGPDSLERSRADTHASSILYPAIERAMGELSKLHEGFNMEVNRAFNILHDAFWSECPAPASAARSGESSPALNDDSIRSPHRAFVVLHSHVRLYPV